MVNRLPITFSLTNEQVSYILPSSQLGSSLRRSLPCSTTRERLLLFWGPVPFPEMGPVLSWSFTLTYWLLRFYPLVEPCFGIHANQLFIINDFFQSPWSLCPIYWKVSTFLALWLLDLAVWLQCPCGGITSCLSSQLFLSHCSTLFPSIPLHLGKLLNYPQHLNLNIQTCCPPNITSHPFSLFSYSHFTRLLPQRFLKTLNSFYICTFLYSLISISSLFATVHRFFHSHANTLNCLSLFFIHCIPTFQFWIKPTCLPCWCLYFGCSAILEICQTLTYWLQEN